MCALFAAWLTQDETAPAFKRASANRGGHLEVGTVRAVAFSANQRGGGASGQARGCELEVGSGLCARTISAVVSGDGVDELLSDIDAIVDIGSGKSGVIAACEPAITGEEREASEVWSDNDFRRWSVSIN